MKKLFFAVAMLVSGASYGKTVSGQGGVGIVGHQGGVGIVGQSANDLAEIRGGVG